MQIHYFQRYHSKENVDTSNTMLMLSRLYTYNADYFFAMLNSLILKTDESPEITFELQVSGDKSVPDAVISQKSFKVVVETKLYNQFEINQLYNHLNKFASEEIKVLLTIDPKPMKEKFRMEFEEKLMNYNAEHKADMHTPIKHINITFEELVEAMEDIIDDRDSEIMSVLEDYKKYCFDEELIKDRYKWMRAIVTGASFEQNLRLNLYYDNADRGFSEHGYIGLYKDKSVRAIGKLTKTVLAEVVDSELVYETEYGDKVTQDELDRINIAITEAEEEFGFELKTIKHRYFFVDEFYEIDFRKASKYPIQKSKYFNLAEMFAYDTMPETKMIAKDLDGRTWEEY